MNTLLIVFGQAAFIVILFFMGIFAVTSLAEGQGRACQRSLAIFVLIAGINIALYFSPEKIGRIGFGLILALSAAGLLLVLLSPRPGQKTEITGRPRRVDERDIIFSRFDLREGSSAFAEYYRRRPEREKEDAMIRRIPDILSAPHLKKIRCYTLWQRQNSAS